MPSRVVTWFLALTLALAAGPTARAATEKPPSSPPPATVAPAPAKPAPAPTPAKPGPVTAKPAPAPAKAAPAAAKPVPGDEWIAVLETSVRKSYAALHRYEWTETTVVTVKGEETSRKETRCRFGDTGKLQRDEAPAAGAGGKTAHATPKRGITTSVQGPADVVKEATGLVVMYMPLEPARIQAAREGGRVTVTSPDAQGKAHFVIADYATAGDSVAVDLDTGTNRFGGIVVKTFAGKVKHAGTLEVGMASLPDGTAYPSDAHLELKEEGVTVAVKNSGHKKMPPSV